MKPKQKFQQGELATLIHYLPPLLSGSQVTILDVAFTGREYRYRIMATEYHSDAKWVYEDDLRRPLLEVEG